MNKQIVSTPLVYPVTLIEAKEQLRLNALNTAFDTLIDGFIETATSEAEKFTRRRFLNQTWDVFADKFPKEHYFQLPFGSLNSVVHFKYKDVYGVETIINPTSYIEDNIGSRLVLAYEEEWPSNVELYPVNPIEIRFSCGYLLPSEVPQAIKDAIRIKISDLFINANDTILSNMLFISRLNSFERLLWPYKVHTNVNF